MPLLPPYAAYRSVVRARVAWLGAPREEGPARAAALARCRAYLAQASRLLAPGTPHLVIAHGLSGSGKTWQSHRCALAEDYIQLRSDVERTRPAGLAPTAPIGSRTGAGIYSTRINDATIAWLHQLAALLLRAGRRVIVDAIFHAATRRDRFRALSAGPGCGFNILACSTPKAELRGRIQARRT